MVADRQLSLNFRLSEFPGWERATEAQVARLALLVDMVLQPARRANGALRPTSWINGTHTAGSAHATGDAVDFVALETSNAAVHQWIATYLPGMFGELILEPDNTLVGGGGAHVHVTNWGHGGEGQVLVEREGQEGRYTLGAALASAPGMFLLALLFITALLAVAARITRP